MLTIFASIFTLACSGAAILAEPVHSASSAAPQEPEVSPASQEWQDLVTRDDTVSFSRRAAADALAEWAEGDLSGTRRALILLTLGSANDDSMKRRLVEASKQDSALTSRAAMLALGEGGFVDLDLLSEWMKSPQIQVRESGLLAGLLSRAPVAIELAELIVSDPSHAMNESARRIMTFTANRNFCEESDAVRWYLDMRYEAARQFGLIGGESWSAIVLRQVVEDEAFLDAVVLPATANLPANGIKDHLMHSLVEGSGRSRVGAAVIAMPQEVNSLIEHGVWQPRNADDWDALLDAIWENHLEEDVGAILVRALDVPAQKQRAAASIARLDNKELSRVFRPSVLLTEGTTAADRGWAIEFLVYAGEDDAAEYIRPYLEDESRVVRAKAHVALLRMSTPGASLDVTALFAATGNSDRASVLLELCAQAQSGPVIRVLNELLSLEVLDLEQRIRVGASLILSARGGAPASFAEEIRSVPIYGELGALTIRALGERGLKDDLDLVASYFPQEGDPLVNLAAARVLVERGMPEAIPILQAALWRGPWDRSILACGLLVKSYGFRLLVDELERPPLNVTSRDLRRVGFALGEWGGLKSVENFARDLGTGTGDPILQGAMLGALSRRTH